MGLSPNKFNTVKVNDVNNDFHFAKRKKTGTWINSNMFIQTWKAIKDEGVWAGNEPWGEDLFAQRCMDLHGVDKVQAFDINTDASCAAWRPEGQKKNRKWRPDCATAQTPAIHHFKTPEEYFNCLKATQR